MWYFTYANTACVGKGQNYGCGLYFANFGGPIWGQRKRQKLTREGRARWIVSEATADNYLDKFVRCSCSPLQSCKVQSQLNNTRYLLIIKYWNIYIVSYFWLHNNFLTSPTLGASESQSPFKWKIWLGCEFRCL